MTRIRKRLTFALWGLAMLALLGVGSAYLLKPDANFKPTDILGVGDYSLQGTDGSVFSQEALRGEPYAVFFGFTHCPEVCPTTLGDVATWQEALKEKGKSLRVFFVTVDPERDTAEVLKDYVSWVDGVSGVTGHPDEVAKAIRAFRIYARKVPLSSGGYTMDHSASVLLFDKNGKFYEPIGYQEGYDRAIEKIERLLDG